jgi:hypothetical protein
LAHTLETTSTYGDFLKYRYRDAIIQATPEYSTCLQKIQQKSAKIPFGGKSITFPVTYNSMGSTGSYDEGDVLPVSLPMNIDNAVVPIYYHYFGCAVSGQAISMSEDKESAFARAWAQEILVKMRAFRQNLNRQLCGDGNAILCQVDGSTDSPITVDNAGGWSGYNSSAVNGARFLTKNMYVQARASGTVHDGGLLITAVTKGIFPSTSAIITVTGTASSVVDGDYLYTSATSTASTDSYGHEMPGLKLLIDDNTVAATVQSISATNYPEWRAQIGYGATHGTAEALTTLRMMNLMSDIQMDGGGKVDWIITSPAVWNTYGYLADQGNQIMNAKVYDTAWPTLEFNGVEIWQDMYMPDEMFFIDNRSLALYTAGDAGWIEDSSGAVITQVKGNTAAYDQMEAYWRWYLTLGINNRAWNGKLTDITVSVNKF